MCVGGHHLSGPSASDKFLLNVFFLGIRSGYEAPPYTHQQSPFEPKIPIFNIPHQPNDQNSDPEYRSCDVIKI